MESSVNMKLTYKQVQNVRKFNICHKFFKHCQNNSKSQKFFRYAKFFLGILGLNAHVFKYQQELNTLRSFEELIFFVCSIILYEIYNCRTSKLYLYQPDIAGEMRELLGFLDKNVARILKFNQPKGGIKRVVMGIYIQGTKKVAIFVLLHQLLLTLACLKLQSITKQGQYNSTSTWV